MSNYELEQKLAAGRILKWSTLAIITILVVVVLVLWGCPNYRVYQQGLEGEAELKRAQQNLQIVIQEAQAKKEAAKMLAEAEVIRARGVDSVNRIIGQGLKGNDAYLHYLWLQQLGANNNEVIYVPTEANLPIMEAGRFSRKNLVDTVQ